MELHITFPELNLASRRSSLLIVLGSGVIPLAILFADPGWYKQVLPTSVLVDSENQQCRLGAPQIMYSSGQSPSR